MPPFYKKYFFVNLSDVPVFKMTQATKKYVSSKSSEDSTPTNRAHGY